MPPPQTTTLSWALPAAAWATMGPLLLALAILLELMGRDTTRSACWWQLWACVSLPGAQAMHRLRSGQEGQRRQRRQETGQPTARPLRLDRASLAAVPACRRSIWASAGARAGFCGQDGRITSRLLPLGWQ